ncbi:MAG: hypothetical protein Q8L48_16850 [Archangium sp.]|nr:hypothetical protein [Archangium sp.]
MSRNRPIILPPGAAQLQKEEGEKAILWHLDEGNKQVGVVAGYFEMLMREEVRRNGLPPVHDQVGRDLIVEKASLMAEAAAKWSLKKRSEIVAEVVTELKVRDVPDHMVWACKRTGVNLVLAPSAAVVAEEPSPIIKTDH